MALYRCRGRPFNHAEASTLRRRPSQHNTTSTGEILLTPPSNLQRQRLMRANGSLQEPLLPALSDFAADNATRIRHDDECIPAKSMEHI